MTELVVLSVLLDAHIVSAGIFAAMILMAVASTTISMPLARLALAKSESGVPRETRSRGIAVGEVRPSEANAKRRSRSQNSVSKSLCGCDPAWKSDPLMRGIGV